MTSPASIGWPTATFTCHTKAVTSLRTSISTGRPPPRRAARRYGLGDSREPPGESRRCARRPPGTVVRSAPERSRRVHRQRRHPPSLAGELDFDDEATLDHVWIVGQVGGVENGEGAQSQGPRRGRHLELVRIGGLLGQRLELVVAPFDGDPRVLAFDGDPQSSPRQRSRRPLLGGGDQPPSTEACKMSSPHTAAYASSCETSR